MRRGRSDRSAEVRRDAHSSARSATAIPPCAERPRQRSKRSEQSYRYCLSSSLSVGISDRVSYLNAKERGFVARGLPESRKPKQRPALYPLIPLARSRSTFV